MKQKKGFTLVELIGVIMILALLLVILIPNIGRVSENSKISLKNSKINTIVIAGEKYGNELINRYQKCVGSESSTLNGCTVSISDLIENGYLEADKDDSIMDPLTNEPMNGKVLLCYNPKEISIYGTYIEGNDQFSCSEFSVGGTNSINLSSISGDAYVNGDKVLVNIISSGEFDREFSCESSDKKIATCKIDGKILEVTPTSYEFTEKESKIVTITVTGLYLGNSLNKIYTLRVHPTAISIVDPASSDPSKSCLPISTTDYLKLEGLNEGKLSVTSSRDDILEGTAKDGILSIASKDETGKAVLTIHESHGHKEATLTRIIYKLMVGDGRLSDKLIVDDTTTIPITYDATGPIEITAEHPDIVHFSSANNPEAPSITLNGDTKFTIIAKEIGSTKIKIAGTTCGTFEFDFNVTNL